MFKTKVGYSTNEDAFLAANESAKMVRQDDNIKLSIIFSNSKMEQDKIIEGIKEELGDKPIIGSTSSNGIMVPSGILSGNSYLGMMSFIDESTVIGVAGEELGEENPRDIGKRVAREAITKAGIKKVPSYFYIVCSPKEEEEYLKGIEDVIGSVPFFGGSASDDNYTGEWKIICNDKAFSSGCAVAFFYAKNEMKSVFTGKYTESEKVGIITKVNSKRRLLEIDGVPALDKYAEWINENKENLIGKKIFTASIKNPFGIKDPVGKLTAIRQPVLASEDNSIYISNDLVENTAIIGMKSSIEEILNSNIKCLQQLDNMMKRDVDSYLLINSVGRKIALADNEEEFFKQVKNFVGERNFLMAFTFNQYGSYEHCGSTCGSLMMNYTGFSK